jgi:hypothetical protein
MSQKTLTLEERVEAALKFTPVTYTIDLYGWGGEIAIGTVKPEIYQYFQDNGLDIEEYAHDWDYAEDNDIPEDLRPFEAGSWHECDDICHESGIALGSGCYLRVLDENEAEVFSCELDHDAFETAGIETEETEEVYVNEQQPGTCVFIGQSVDKGTFDGYRLPLSLPFDPRKLRINYGDYEGWCLVSSITYDGEYLDSLGNLDTSGMSAEYQMLRVGDSS